MKKILSICLSIILILTPVTNAFAAVDFEAKGKEIFNAVADKVLDSLQDAVDSAVENVTAFLMEKFSDAKDIPSWAKEHVAAFLEENIVNGYTDGTFRPNKEMTYGEVVKLLNDFREENGLEYLKPDWDDFMDSYEQPWMPSSGDDYYYQYLEVEQDFNTLNRSLKTFEDLKSNKEELVKRLRKAMDMGSNIKGQCKILYDEMGRYIYVYRLTYAYNLDETEEKSIANELAQEVFKDEKIFPNVKRNHWAFNEFVEYMANNSYYRYYDDTMTLNQAITRDEFVTLFYMVLGGDKNIGYYHSDYEYKAEKFKDLDKTNLKKPIKVLVEHGLINGTSDTTFSPKKQITRAEVVTLLDRYLQWRENDYIYEDKTTVELNCYDNEYDRNEIEPLTVTLRNPNPSKLEGLDVETISTVDTAYPFYFKIYKGEKEDYSYTLEELEHVIDLSIEEYDKKYPFQFRTVTNFERVYYTYRGINVLGEKHPFYMEKYNGKLITILPNNPWANENDIEDAFYQVFFEKNNNVYIIRFDFIDEILPKEVTQEDRIEEIKKFLGDVSF